jgi:hypothetical protein
MRILTTCVLLILGRWTVARAAEPGQLHLEVAQAERGSVDAPQRWLEELRQIPFASVRMRAARPNEAPQMDSDSRSGQSTLRVTAVLTARNELHVPGGRFRLGQRDRMLQWIEQLPIGEKSAAPAAFGLTRQELDQVQTAVAAPVDISTKSLRLSALIDSVRDGTGLSIGMAGGAGRIATRDAIIADELRGVSSGTALAAALRPLGYGFVPQRSAAGRLQLHIAPLDEETETWPVGRAIDRAAAARIPKLFERVPVEIVDTPLAQALEALQNRIGIPLLVDHAGLAAQQIAWEDVKVRFPVSKTSYKRVLDGVLFRARLEAEIRTDDGQRPFLWVQPVRRAAAPARR